MADTNRRAFAGCISDFIFTEDPVEKADIIFIPGNGYPQMAEEAATLFHHGCAPVILPSGKYYIYDREFDGVKAHQSLYKKSYVTEWEFLKDVLITGGVPPSAILKEDRALYTYQNACNSRIVTDQAGMKIHTAIVCCLSAHARRCRMYYGLLYPEARILIHPIAANGITKDNWMDTDEGIDLVLGEMQRCGGQFAKILKDLKEAQTEKPE